MAAEARKRERERERGGGNIRCVVVLSNQVCSLRKCMRACIALVGQSQIGRAM